MNVFIISNITVFFSNILITTLIFLKGRKQGVSRVLGYLSFVVVLWGLGAYIFSTTKVKEIVYLGWQVGYICCILTSPLYFHFVYLLLKLKGRFYKYLLTAVYILSAVFLMLVFFAKEFFLGDLRFVFNQFYWTDWSPIWLIYHISFNWILLSYAFFLLLRAFLSSTGSLRNQLKYFILGSIIGWIGAHGDYLVVFRDDIYPYSNFLLALHPAIWAYAIIKYRLMDIKIAMTRSGIFLILYTFVLGFPFYIGYQTKSWFLSTSLAVAFATIGPLVYRFLQKKAEDLILVQQRRYQQMLVSATQNIIKVYHLERLLKWIVYTLKRVVRIKYAAIFLDDKENKVFRLRTKRDNGEIPNDLVFSYNHPFLVYMKERKEPFFFMELPDYIKMSLSMPFEISIIIPSFIENKQLGFLILGEKIDQTPYSADDVNVFKILAHQAGLAIENAQLYNSLQDELKRLSNVLRQLQETQGQLIQTKKVAAIGQLAAGVAHEINNPLFVISGKAELLLSRRINDKYVQDSANLILEQSKRIQEITERLLEFSRTKEFKQEIVDVNDILNDTIILLKYQSKLDNKKIIKELDGTIPSVFAEKNQLQEVFLNIMLNALQAMEKGGTLRINTHREKITDAQQKVFTDGEEIVVMEFQDTGKGMDEQTLARIFDPFFSTKEKGAGLGLSICYGIIEKHRGAIEAYSQIGKGSTFVVKLPVRRAGDNKKD